MKKRHFVRATTPCHTCDEDCYVVHPTWKRYGAQLGNLTVPEFFLSEGYLPGEALPPARIICPTCKGLGELATTVPATRPSEGFSLAGFFYKILGGAPL